VTYSKRTEYGKGKRNLLDNGKTQPIWPSVSSQGQHNLWGHVCVPWCKRKHCAPRNSFRRPTAQSKHDRHIGRTQTDILYNTCQASSNYHCHRKQSLKNYPRGIKVRSFIASPGK
jgi:hypothetical protein